MMDEEIKSDAGFGGSFSGRWDKNDERKLAWFWMLFV